MIAAVAFTKSRVEEPTDLSIVPAPDSVEVVPGPAHAREIHRDPASLGSCDQPLTRQPRS